MVGEKYGNWEVIQEPFLKQLKRQKQSYVLCRCACGTEKIVPVVALKKGRTTQCKPCATRKQATKHSMHGSPEYKIWSGMRVRCNSKSHRLYKYYGGRGIKVDSRWDSFEQFFSDMGPRPSAEYTIDRLDNEGDYTPENCAWRTKKEQSRNTRRNHMITHGGKTQPLVAWAEERGISPVTLHTRIAQYGWSVERALTEPVHVENRKKR